MRHSIRVSACQGCDVLFGTHKICKMDMTLGVQENVVGLQVSVDNALLVYVP